MKLWLDDIRPMPQGYDKHVLTAKDAIKELATGKVTHISFDHDLGDFKTGYNVACFIETGAHDQTIPRLTWDIHSANPVGRRNIEQAMISAERWWVSNDRFNEFNDERGSTY